MQLVDVLTHAPNLQILGLTCDARLVQPGFLYVAWRGLKHDGHDFIPDALARGAVCIVGEAAAGNDLPVPYIHVADARRFLAQAAQCFYHDPSAAMQMVGITGTNGKTTTAHLVQSMLQYATDDSIGIIGTLGAYLPGKSLSVAPASTLTTPDTVTLMALLQQMHLQGAKAVAMEVSSQALHQSRVAGVFYDVAVFLNLSQDHLDYHITEEAYFAAKARLFHEQLKTTGIAVINHDDTWGRKLAASLAIDQSRILFSMQDHSAAVHLLDVQLQRTRMQLRIAVPHDVLLIESALIGRFNAENILAAVAVGVALQLPYQAIAAGIAMMQHVPGRLERIMINHAKIPLVVVDYAHSPDALQKTLMCLREIVQGRLCCVFGCGGNRDTTKRFLMGEIAAKYADWVIVTSDNPRSEDPLMIAAAIEQGLRAQGGQYCTALDRAQAIAQAVAWAGPQDAICIAGKGHETYQIIGDAHMPFDDRICAKQALEQRYGR